MAYLKKLLKKKKKKKDQCGEHSKHRREGYEGVGIIGHILLEAWFCPQYKGVHLMDLK